MLGDLNSSKTGCVRANVVLRRVREVTVVYVRKQCVTYSECVSLALSTQYGMRMHHMFICGQFVSTIFFHI